MNYFIGTILAGCLGIASLNLWTDPWYFWHRTVVFAPRALLPSEVWPWSDRNVEERDMKLLHLRLIPKPDVVILGSSRAQTIESSLFDSRRSVFNAASSAALVTDYLVYWDALKEMDKIPSHVLILADQNLFNESCYPYSWLSDGRWVQEYGGTLSKAQVLWRKFSFLGLKVSDLMSSQALRESLNAVRHMWNRPPATTGIVQEKDAPRDKKGYRWDGSLYYPESIYQHPNVDEIHRKALIDIGRPDLYLYGHWTFSTAAYNLMDAFLTDMDRHHTRALIIIPPFQPFFLQLLRARPDTHQMLEESTQALTRLAQRHPSVVLCNAEDPAVSHCTEADFVDTVHMFPPCVKAVVDRCLQSDPDWKALQAKTN